MPVIIDEFSVDVQPSTPKPAVTSTAAPTKTPVDPQELAKALSLQAERSARLFAD